MASSGAPFGCGMVSGSVRTRADCERSVGLQGSVACMGHPVRNGQLIRGCHGDGDGSAPAQHFLSLHCSCRFQQTSHSFAVAAVGDGVVDAVVVVSLMTSPAGSPALRWNPQTLHYLLQLRMWHYGCVSHSGGGISLQRF